MRKKLIIPLLLSGILLISAGCPASGAVEQTALDAFNSMMDGTDSQAESEAVRTDSYTYLDAIMAGDFSVLPGDQDSLETMAASLTLLTAITPRDIASYASSKGYTAAQVRNAYYKALANVIRAGLRINPEAGGEESNLAILSLFLQEEPDASVETEKAEIREEMTPEYSEEVAMGSGLPEGFVETVIMSGTWEDENWENDDDWKQGTAWAEEGFTDITIGMRDNPGDDRIAKLQEALISLGYLKGKADGVFGVRTQSALLEFQMANALMPNGICTAEVMKKLAAADAVSRRDYGNAFWDTESGQARGGTAAGYDTPDDDDGDYDTPDDNTPDDDYDTPDNDRDYNTPENDGDYNTPDNNTPDYNTPDNNTPDYNTPDYNTPDNNTPDYDTPDDD